MIVIRSMRLILAARRPAFSRASSCSQIRTTSQPARRNVYVTIRGGDVQSPFGFIRQMNQHPVVEAGPGRVRQ